MNNPIPATQALGLPDLKLAGITQLEECGLFKAEGVDSNSAPCIIMIWDVVQW
jgi:hypothetical protein